MTPTEAENEVGEALYRKMQVRWKRQDKIGLPKPPRFKEKETVYLRVKNDAKGFKSGDPVVDKNRYVITEVTPTQPLASYKLRMLDFPYSALPNSFDESRLIGAKDL